VHIADTTFTALDDHPLLFVVSECVEQLSGFFIPYKSSYRNSQSYILSIGAVLIFGSAWLTRFGFEDAFVSVRQQGILIFGCLQDDGSSFPAIAAGWTSERDSGLSPAGHDTISSRA
jgi:hypothetical protein